MYIYWANSPVRKLEAGLLGVYEMVLGTKVVDLQIHPYKLLHCYSNVVISGQIELQTSLLGRSL